MHWEESGSASARPVLYLHGGPGGGFAPVVRQIFDPDAFRLVCYDQRGCGQSGPQGELRENDLEALLLDIERLRTHLGIAQWLLCGSSWGATLACEYAKRHPEVVDGVMVYGVFLGRSYDIKRFLVGGRDFMPGAWREFSSWSETPDARSILEGYWSALTGPAAQAAAAALTWARYEIALSQFPTCIGGPISISRSAAVALARVSVHFFRHGCFLPEDGVLPGLEALGDIPLRVVHGSQDAVCDVEAGRTLVACWPNSQLTIVEGAGHIPIGANHWAALSNAMNDLSGKTK